MPDTSWHEEVGRRVVTSQIIVAALLAGVLVFLVIAAMLIQSGTMKPNREFAETMNVVLLLFLIGDLTARLIVPRNVVARARRNIADGTWRLPQGSGEQQTARFASFIEQTGDAGRLLAVHLTKTIIAVALLEGAAFFAIIAYLITGSMLALVIAVALIVALAFHIPTRSGVVHWIENQLQLIEHERRL